MKRDKLKDIFSTLVILPGEIEWIEFKEAKNNFDFNKLGMYFSALSNEANLKEQECGWLIFGVSDTPPRKIVGTQFRSNRSSLDELKRSIAEKTNNHLTFTEIYELFLPERILLFQIPSAIAGMPTAWDGHFYGRDGESLSPLNMKEIEEIRKQCVTDDWSMRICEESSLNDLDPESIQFARKQYKEKNPKHSNELETWDNKTFLNKAKVCINGKITNAALILLGKEESEHYLSPAISKISWILKDESGIEKDYRHFSPPMILAVNKVYEKIRNLTYRYLPNASLFPTEISQYDPWVIREILHNCIAHQDYLLGGRINVVEFPDSLLFTNLGNFIPGSVEDVIWQDSPPSYYRNQFLAQAMVNLNMIDTIGSGIKRMFITQRNRFFPMPDYDLSNFNQVQVRLFGKIMDENYTHLLIDRSNLQLTDVIALDKVQKKKSLTDEEFKRLKNQNLIEGRRPNLFVSAKIAKLTGEKAEYIKHKAFNKEHYKQMIVAYLKKFGEAKRDDFEELLLVKLSDALTSEQKKTFIRNLLQEMRRDGIISPTGLSKRTKWILSLDGN